MKNTLIYLLVFSVLTLFLISACTPENAGSDEQQVDDRAASCPPSQLPADFCPEGQLIETVDENGCYTKYECTHPPFDASALTVCLNECEGSDYDSENNRQNCQINCYNQRAKFTKDSQDCNAILELAKQNPVLYYSRYFTCMIHYIGITDPALCDIVQDDYVNYPYCIMTIAMEANNSALCDSKKKLDKVSYKICVEAVRKGHY